MSTTETKFYELCNKAKELWEQTYGTNELEPVLLEILNFSKDNSYEKETIEKCFVSLVSNSNYPFEILEFCMRELRFNSVLEAMTSEVTKMTEVEKMDTVLHRVFDVYEDIWENADLYPYYEHEIHKNT